MSLCFYVFRNAPEYLPVLCIHAPTFYYPIDTYYSLQYNCDKEEKLDFPLPNIPTVSHYEKYGIFIKQHTSWRGVTVGIVGRGKSGFRLLLRLYCRLWYYKTLPASFATTLFNSFFMWHVKIIRVNDFAGASEILLAHLNFFAGVVFEAKDAPAKVPCQQNSTGTRQKILLLITIWNYLTA